MKKYLNAQKSMSMFFTCTLNQQKKILETLKFKPGQVQF